MPVLPLRFYGDPVLREKARPIREVTDEVRQFVASMGETMYDADGIGLAANQVGDLRRILVIDVAQSENRRRKAAGQAEGERELEVYLNAQIVDYSAEDATYEEGCLSIPGINAEIYRPLVVTIEWMDLDGRTHREEFDGLRARVLQHEIDHLDGVLFVDHLAPAKRERLAPELNRVRREYQKDSSRQ